MADNWGGGSIYIYIYNICTYLNSIYAGRESGERTAWNTQRALANPRAIANSCAAMVGWALHLGQELRQCSWFIHGRVYRRVINCLRVLIPYLTSVAAKQSAKTK